MSRTRKIDVADVQRMRRRILQGSDQVPPLPDVVHKLLELINRDDAEPMEFEAVLEHSPALAGKLLGLVNSALFGVQHPVTSIHHAVLLLGHWPLRNMVLAYGAGELMLTDFSCYGHSARGLWEHSVAVAAASRSLALRTDLDWEDRELVFLAGLLHDIGKMLIAPYLSAGPVNMTHFPGDIRAMERQFCGLDHTEAGALVIAKWNLPDTLQEVVEHQHGGEGPADYRTHIAILRLAEAVAHEMGIGYLPGQGPEAIYRAADLGALGNLGAGLDWEQAREGMEEAVRVALVTMAEVFG
ncbi:MAG: HDOD domain-containing protein [Planctomycetota bacterium]